MDNNDDQYKKEQSDLNVVDDKKNELINNDESQVDFVMIDGEENTKEEEIEENHNIGETYLNEDHLARAELLKINEQGYKKDCEYRKEGKKQSGLPYLAMGLIGAVIGGMIVISLTPIIYGKMLLVPGTSGNSQIGQQIVIKTTGEENTASAVAKKVMPTVVGISTVTVETDFFMKERELEGVGSGVVVNANGYILTNSHVVGINSKKLTVYFMDGLELEGKVLWQDTTLDMAIVKVEASQLPTAELGDSDNIAVGALAIAIGNPLGLRFERTVTQGIISGLNRSIMLSQNEIMEDLIQTDAAINPGNSGGPLINATGQIIGINTVKASAEGLGFAIPINISKPIIEQLIQKGSFTPTYLGVSMYDKEIAGYYQNTVDIKSGVYIIDIVPNAPAAKAGLKEKDIITHLDDIEVNTMVKLKTILYTKKPGDKIKVTYLRDNKEHNVEVILQEKPVQQ